MRLTADHYGLPAGTEVMVGYAESSAKVDIPAKLERRHKPVPPPVKPKKKKQQAPPRGRRRAGAGVGPEVPSFTVRPPPDVTPKLTAGGYVFPVYGPSSFGDTFGAPRGDVASGWHHGEDIFGQLGTPLLAVADGTVFSVGWNDLGGYRLWLRDRAGNEFYYAHLSAYSPFAVNGREVKAGTVLGFMGNTGDAVSTPYHLHFEIHPVGLLYLGYDGAVRAVPVPPGVASTCWTSSSRRSPAGRRPSPRRATRRDPARSCSRPPTSRRPTGSTRAHSSARSSEPAPPTARPLPYFEFSWRYSNSSPSPKTLF